MKNSDKLHVTDESVRFILYQRSELLAFPRMPGARLIRKIFSRYIPIFKIFTFVESRIRKNIIKKEFSRDISREYEEIKNYLPEKFDNVLDIGAGVAGIDVFLFHHNKENNPKIITLDKTQLDKNIFFKYDKANSYYNSADVSTNFLLENGIPRSNITTLEANDNGTIDIDSSIDLIISLKSWGFHYPVSFYLEEVNRILSPNGTIIMDLRRTNSDGFALLKKTFPNIEIIETKKKSFRLKIRAQH